MSKSLGHQLRRLLRREVRRRAPRLLSRRRPRMAPPGRPAPAGGTSGGPSPHAAREYPVPPSGLPPLEYAPQADGEPDPGEIVWAWVPYEDDPRLGKDRPVLVIARMRGGFLGLQLTSQDHSRNTEREAHFGRNWLSIGSGSWDSQRRDSEVRLDRVLFLPPLGVRREGASLDKQRYLEVAAALRALHT